jgi:hypothetical protein
MILPLKLAYFDAKIKKAGTDLTWKVTENGNAASFEIETSMDGQHFDKIGVVQASENEGSQVYTYFVSGNNTNNYYRLKIKDSHGNVDYSKIISMNTAGMSTMRLKVSNPVYSSATITYESSQNARCNIRVFNIAGVQVYSQSVDVQAGFNKILVPEAAMKTIGTYILEVTDQLRNRRAHRLVKM